MRCPSCNKKIKDSSLFCNYCGQEITLSKSPLEIPDGFVYDKASGWYHNIELKRNKKGKLLQEVTYFNPEENWFLLELPNDHPSYGEDQEKDYDAPIGEVSEYLYDEVQDLYYLTDVQLDPKRKEIIQRVSYYYPKENTFTNVNYLILDENPKLSEKKENSGDVRGNALTRLFPRKEKKASSRTVGLRSLALFLGLLSILFGTYQGLLWTNIMPTDFFALAAQNFTLDEISNSLTPRESAWPDFPYVSSQYKGAQQEGEFLYFLGTSKDDVEGIYRFVINSQDFELVVESPDKESMISSFAVTDQYVYYCVSFENDIEARYYRLDKKTGAFQFLFEADYSALVAWENTAYILCSSNNRLRSLFETTTNPKAYEETSISVEPGAFLLSNNFSVRNGVLYYSEARGRQHYFYKLVLSTGEKTELVQKDEKHLLRDISLQQDKVYFTRTTEDSKFSFVEQDKVKERETILAEEKSSSTTKFFATRVGAKFVFATNEGTQVANYTKPEKRETIYHEAPIAVTKNWVVFSGAVYSLMDDKLYEMDTVSVFEVDRQEDTASSEQKDNSNPSQ